MATAPPTGYGYYAATWDVDGSNRNVVTTWGFKNNAGATAAGANALFSSTILFSGGELLDMALASSTYTRVQGYTLLNVGGVLQSASTNYATAGSVAAAVVTPNVSLVVNKHTAIAGRSGRGHMAIPGGYLTEAEVDAAGLVDNTFLTAFDIRLQSSFTLSNSNGLPLYLLHANGSTPTAVTSVSVSSQIGTQRHRLKR